MTTTDTKYTTMTTTGGQRSVLTEGFIVVAVFVTPGHEALAQRVADLLNAEVEATVVGPES